MIYIVKRTEGYWVATNSLREAKEEYCDGRHCKECRLSWLNQSPSLQCKQCGDEELVRRFGNDLRIVNSEEKPKNAQAFESERRDCGWTSIEEDYPVSVQQVINITAEMGALATQSRIRELKPYKLPERKKGRWIIHQDWLDEGLCGYECPNCGRCYDYPMNFCGFCGNPMEVGHEQS